VIEPDRLFSAVTGSRVGDIGVISELLPADPDWLGPFRVTARLGAGGMGQVFLCQSAGGRPVAVKMIRAELAVDPEFRVRFQREVAAARKVSGLYTALLIDADADGPVPWLATAYVNGPSLSEAVRHKGPLPASSVLALAAGLAEGIAAIHAAGVVHRDLKPSNVLLAEDGPRVIDFGISRAAETTSLTEAGFIIGSAGFMAPEQATGHRVGPPSDIFSLGSVLVFAATGTGPFGTGGTAALVYRVVHGEPELAGVPAPVRELASRCLAKDPADRPTAADLLAQIGATPPMPGWIPASMASPLAPSWAVSVLTDGMVISAAEASVGTVISGDAAISAAMAPTRADDGAVAKGESTTRSAPRIAGPEGPPMGGEPGPASPPGGGLSAESRDEAERSRRPFSRRSLLTAAALVTGAGAAAGIAELLTQHPAGKILASGAATGTASPTVSVSSRSTPAAARITGQTRASEPSPSVPVPKPVLRWQQSLGATAGIFSGSNGGGAAAGLALSDGVVFAAAGSQLYAMSTDTGSRQWAFPADATIAGAPVAVSGTVYVASGDAVYAVDTRSGQQQQVYQAGGTVSDSPSVTGSVLYVGGDSVLSALPLGGGPALWTYDASNAILFGPVVSAGVAYVVAGSDTMTAVSLQAVSTATGRARWTIPLASAGARPAVAGDLVYQAGGDLYADVQAFEVATGQQRWRYHTGGVIYSVPGMAQDTVFFGSEDRNFYAVNADTAAFRWQRTTGGYNYSSPATADGAVYFGSLDQYVYSLDALTGAVRWKYLTNGQITAGPAVAGGVVYARTAAGEIYAIGQS
jgi:serine/threonine protein kinase/outer membrane protein assembly factor BamB